MKKGYSYYKVCAKEKEKEKIYTQYFSTFEKANACYLSIKHRGQYQPILSVIEIVEIENPPYYDVPDVRISEIIIYEEGKEKNE